MLGDRIDLPKGRMEEGESELECALRELEEETGIAPHQIKLVDGFRSVTTQTKPGRTKTLVLFAAEAVGPLAVTPHDHDDYAWMNWAPPHAVAWPRLQRALEDWAEHLALSTDLSTDAKRSKRAS